MIKNGTQNSDPLRYKDPFQVWSPVSNKENKYNYSVRERRYLGTTIDGYLIENPNYPADAYSGKPFSEFEWHNFTLEIEEAMMKSVYPMAEGKRTLVSKTTKERISRSL